MLIFRRLGWCHPQMQRYLKFTIYWGLAWCLLLFISYSYHFFLEAKCEPPGQIPNGQIKGPLSLQVGKSVYFSCNEGWVNELALYVPAVNYKANRRNMDEPGCYSRIIQNEVVREKTNKRVAVQIKWTCCRFKVKLTSFQHKLPNSTKFQPLSLGINYKDNLLVSV